MAKLTKADAARVAALEQECEALRQRELLRPWESTGPPPEGDKDE